jgi:hypothetical protein
MAIINKVFPDPVPPEMVFNPIPNLTLMLDR